MLYHLKNLSKVEKRGIAMLDLTKIQLIAQSYSPQELFAALVWQHQFN